MSKYKKTVLSIAFLFCIFGFTAITAQTQITGKVLDESGEAVIGATVIEKNTTNGTVTDIDGAFSLKVGKGSSIIVSLIGYTTQTIEVGQRTFFEVLMKEDNKMLDEVVVTALGLKREEKALGYAVQSVKGENFQTVKGLNVATSLTGRIAGLNILNSTEFASAPTIKLRGEDPLIVIDGVPYQNMTLGELPSDDIEDISVLKGPTASALYGEKGQNGAIMITTKKGSGREGLSISVNSGSMFTAGYLAIPSLQGQYGRMLKTNTDGSLEYVRSGDGSWGAPLEGQEVIQWDPFSKTMKAMPYTARGINNFDNFLEQGYVLNNNVSIAQKGKLGNIRASATWIQNKGVYPNSKFDKYTYSIGADIKVDKFTFTTSMSYNKHKSPNIGFNGYTGYDPMYSLLIWSAPDWDIRDYKDYWVIPDEVQNNSYTAGNNNPYFDRYERLHSLDKDVFNGAFEVNYDLAKGVKAIGRVGYDTYSNKQEVRISKGSFQGAGNTKLIDDDSATEVWGESQKGSFNIGQSRGYSINSDLIISATKNINDFAFDAIAGTSINYYQNEGLEGRTKGGLTIPGYYSLKGSVNPSTVSSLIKKRQTNGVYGKMGVSWRSMAFVEGTLRNDWVSTLAESQRSYLYPSLSGSFLISELLPKTNWLSLWKVRGSWVTAKRPANIYEINSNYGINNNVWDGLSSAVYQTLIRGSEIRPVTRSTYEIGTAFNFLKNRIAFDAAYFNRREFDYIVQASISPSSGFSKNLVNSEEERTRTGVELTLNVTPIETKDLVWNMSFNWSKSVERYTKLDPQYSADRTWVKVGERTDVQTYMPFLKDEEGNIINLNGVPTFNSKSFKYGYKDPDWIWGINTNLKYKNWALDISMDGRVGGYMQSITSMYMWRSGGHPDSLTPERYLDAKTPGSKNYLAQGSKVVSGSATFDTYGNIVTDNRVFAPNDIATSYKSYVEALHRGTAWGGDPSEADIFSGTFLKIREISLTYTLPKDIAAKFKAKDASISAIGQNVLFWAKDFKYSDPDGGSENFSDPSQRYLGFNIRLGF